MVLLHNTGSIIFETTEKEHALPFFKDKHENPHPNTKTTIQQNFLKVLKNSQKKQALAATNDVS